MIYSVTLINSIFFTCQDGGELLFYFSLAILGSLDSFTTWARARDLHCRCIYYPEHVYTWEGYSSRSVSYPEHVYMREGYSNRSVSYLEHVYTWEGYRSVIYPEHLYTWKGYSNRSVSYLEHVYT